MEPLLEKKIREFEAKKREAKRLRHLKTKRKIQRVLRDLNLRSENVLKSVDKWNKHWGIK